jgi:hypothetical protein
MLDISLNEVSVHYLGHSNFDCEDPYLDLEKMVVENTKLFYRYQWKNVFEGDLERFNLFLEGDMKYV